MKKVVSPCLCTVYTRSGNEATARAFCEIQFENGKNIKAGWCYRRIRYDEEYRMPPDGFCSYGKRRNGGNGNAKN